jgi:adenylate cyclase
VVIAHRWGFTVKRHARRLTYLAFVFALIGGAILLRYTDPFFVRALRLIAFDYFQRLDAEPYDPNLPARIVDIDEKSLAQIGQWPWPRTVVRDLLLGLTSKGAAAVVFDVCLRAGPHRLTNRKKPASSGHHLLLQGDRATISYLPSPQGHTRVCPFLGMGYTDIQKRLLCR